MARIERRVMVVVGTRPEAIKLAPLILCLRGVDGLAVRLVATGQHRELLAQALGEFGLVPDVDLALMEPRQGLADLTARALVALDRTLATEAPDLVLAQGDTTTVLASALASYYRRVPFGHVEAGLRTGNHDRPFPEEGNRVLAGHLARLHFAPTASAQANLLREGIDPATIHLTGNTGIDALRWVVARLPPIEIERPPTDAERTILLTAHRRENFGAPLSAIADAVLDLVGRYPNLRVVIPVHPNPAVRSLLREKLGEADRVDLVEPTGYRSFVALMVQSWLILTDSGGIQEEGPSLGIPVLVLRDETERPEAVQAGTVRLVGPDRARIVAAVADLWDNPAAWSRMATATNPYGDGFAAERITHVVASHLQLVEPPPSFGFRAEWPDGI